MGIVIVGKIEIACNEFYAERHWECNPILQEVYMEAFSSLSSWFLHNGDSNFNIKEAAHRQRGIHTLGNDNNYRSLFSWELQFTHLTCQTNHNPLRPMNRRSHDQMWKGQLESAQLTEAPDLYWITGNRHFSTTEMGNRVIFYVHLFVSLNHAKPHATITQTGMKKCT